MADTAFNVLVRYRTLEGREDKVLALLARMAAAVRMEPGNPSYEYFQSPEDRRSIVILESYRDEAAFQAHRDAPHTTELGTNGIIPLLADRELITY